MTPHLTVFFVNFCRNTNSYFCYFAYTISILFLIPFHFHISDTHTLHANVVLWQILTQNPSDARQQFYEYLIFLIELQYMKYKKSNCTSKKQQQTNFAMIYNLLLFQVILCYMFQNTETAELTFTALLSPEILGLCSQISSVCIKLL